ncbi:hypothetical protein DLAC_09789 [Tieghemostelium lacteum]|uniref:Uncharacterized protein n=1 Tax=Tieghemostelium lacteum TaxID=361077 RepID=A0A151Z777_TIELA|nr:hypothetical protein DLAC_09789 [Tieghemostelium lacteum]|eukprot:KYQ89816.1 hypothetical protein DLAC_09789 [Tieghemostelium lacteum]
MEIFFNHIDHLLMTLLPNYLYCKILELLLNVYSRLDFLYSFVSKFTLVCKEWNTHVISKLSLHQMVRDFNPTLLNIQSMKILLKSGIDFKLIYLDTVNEGHDALYTKQLETTQSIDNLSEKIVKCKCHSIPRSLSLLKNLNNLTTNLLPPDNMELPENCNLTIYLNGDDNLKFDYNLFQWPLHKLTLSIPSNSLIQYMQYGIPQTPIHLKKLDIYGQLPTLSYFFNHQVSLERLTIVDEQLDYDKFIKTLLSTDTSKSLESVRFSGAQINQSTILDELHQFPALSRALIQMDRLIVTKSKPIESINNNINYYQHRYHEIKLEITAVENEDTPPNFIEHMKDWNIKNLTLSDSLIVGYNVDFKNNHLLNNLNRFCIYYNQIEKKSIGFLNGLVTANLPNLKKLGVQYNYQLGDEFMAPPVIFILQDHLSSLQSNQYLNRISISSISSQDLLQLLTIQQPSITSLKVGYMKIPIDCEDAITPQLVEKLQQNQNLKQFEIFFTSPNFDTSHYFKLDMIIQILSENHNFTKLHIPINAHNKVSDEELQSLKSILKINPQFLDFPQIVNVRVHKLLYSYQIRIKDFH